MNVQQFIDLAWISPISPGRLRLPRLSPPLAPCPRAESGHQSIGEVSGGRLHRAHRGRSADEPHRVGSGRRQRADVGERAAGQAVHQSGARPGIPAETQVSLPGLRQRYACVSGGN